MPAKVSLRRALAAVAVVIACQPEQAYAEPESPYTWSVAVDLPIMGVAAAAAGIAFIELPPAACLPNCVPPDNLNALDRTVLGNYSPTAHTVADVMVIGMAVSPLLFDVIDSPNMGWLIDTAVYAETLLIAQAFTQLTKVAVRRTAPFVYDESVPLEERSNADATRSFFSGHTSTAFTAATAYAVTYWLRHPDDPWRFVVLATGEALALGVGMLKIHAGYHYWTDIAAGALAGASVGTLVPLLHHDW
jgi:membrane-associated phospholipid phosphatase